MQNKDLNNTKDLIVEPQIKLSPELANHANPVRSDSLGGTDARFLKIFTGSYLAR